MRYLILVAAVLMQSCLGATYSWSVYVLPLREITGLLQGPVQIPFTVFYFVFPFTMMIAGNILPAIGTRTSAVIGGLLFGGGWILAGMGSHDFLFTILGIGCISGIGAGMAYIVPIAVCIQWFPKSKGLVTGIAVAGFGGGAAMVSQVGGYLIGNLGWTPFRTFLIFGSFFMVLVTLAGSLMQVPESKKMTRHPRRTPPGRLLSRFNFRLLYLAMFFGLFAGFAVNANLKELYQGTGDAVGLGITAVSLFSLANAAGRVIWGAVFDRISSANAIVTNLFFQGLVLVTAPVVLDTDIGFWTIAFLTGFNYGGVLVIYVSSASRIWGIDHVGRVYGWLFTSNIPASISPILAGLVFDRFKSFDLALYLISGMLMVGGAVVLKSAGRINRRDILA